MSSELEDLADVIAEWGPDHEAWDNIIDGLLQRDPVSEVLEKTSNITPELLSSRINL